MTDCQSEIGEGVNHHERPAINGDVWGRLSTFSHDVHLFQADGQPKLLTGIRLMINQLLQLQISFSMSHQCCIVREKHLMDADPHYLCSGAQASNVEQLTISSGAEVDALSKSVRANLKSMEKNIPKRVSARIQPCFTPLLTGKASEVLPLKQTILCMSSWKMWSCCTVLGAALHL